LSNALHVLLLEIILQWQEFNVFMYEFFKKILWGHATNNWNAFNENKVLLKTLIEHYIFNVSLVLFHFSKIQNALQMT
jgi:hypothetical protein